MSRPNRRASASVAMTCVVLGLSGCGSVLGVGSTTTAPTASTTAGGSPTGGSPTGGTTSASASSSALAPSTTAVTATASAPPTGATGSVPESDIAPHARRALYLVGKDGPGLRLFREFAVVPVGAATGTAADRTATAAVAAALLAPPPYQRPWGEQRGVSTVRKDANGITVTLAPGSAPAVSPDAARLAVASVVWTVTASYQADVPVRIVDPGRSATIGGISTAKPFSRGDGQGTLAGIWVDEPALGAVVPAGRVTVTGQASVWEANVLWVLQRNGVTVRDGVTIASVGAPARGAYSVDLGSLGPGAYTLTLRAPSPKDGSDMARTVRSFVVR